MKIWTDLVEALFPTKRGGFYKDVARALGIPQPEPIRIPVRATRTRGRLHCQR